MGFSHGHPQFAKLYFLQKPAILLPPFIYIPGYDSVQTVKKACQTQDFQWRKCNQTTQQVNYNRGVKNRHFQLIPSISSNHKSLYMPFNLIPHQLLLLQSGDLEIPSSLPVYVSLSVCTITQQKKNAIGIIFFLEIKQIFYLSCDMIPLFMQHKEEI